MKTAITNGIKVSVETFYQPTYSKPLEGKYIFAYRVTIINLGSNQVQLLRRHWVIQDANGSVREIEGEGVIGQQPSLAGGESHQYISWSHLATDMGKMSGCYQMRDLDSGSEFMVNIPHFRLVAPFKLN